MGFRTVALSSGASKEELARKLGAHDYIDGSKVDAAKALQDMGGAKVIVATAPSSGSIQKLLPGLGLEGQLLILGISDDVTTINFSKLHFAILISHGGRTDALPQHLSLQNANPS